MPQLLQLCGLSAGRRSLHLNHLIFVVRLSQGHFIQWLVFKIHQVGGSQSHWILTAALHFQFKLFSFRHLLSWERSNVGVLIRLTVFFLPPLKNIVTFSQLFTWDASLYDSIWIQIPGQWWRTKHLRSDFGIGILELPHLPLIFYP